MKHWLSVANRAAVTLVAVLCISAGTPVAAQQASDPAPQAGASTATSGPRLRPEWRRVEPSFADSSASRPVAVAAGSHTFTVTTLVLVLAVVIAVLVIAD